jgi:hypothetical protein
MNQTRALPIQVPHAGDQIPGINSEAFRTESGRLLTA